jgi:tetratricopeptide (TPR) repeat protein
LLDDALALQRAPEGLECYQNKGFALIQLDRYEEALAVYEQALKIDPTYWAALYEKGLMLEGLGRYEEMLAFYEQRMAREPDDDNIWYWRGRARALDALGRIAEAELARQRASEHTC